MKKYLFALFFLSSFASDAAKPQLVVQIVVDQLRGDLLEQHQSQFDENGFNYLLRHAINYTNAHHPHANTTTCAGHATISTGSYPSLHGVINNRWYDRGTKKVVYCMADLNSKITETPRSKKPLKGRSPRNLTASTLSDEIVLAKKGKAYAVSFKDRAAITLAGHAGQAFWFDGRNGGFISSDFYLTKYPQWVNQWNTNYQPESFQWSLSAPNTYYQNINFPKVPQKDLHFKQDFPHEINLQAPNYFKALSKTPRADELSANFAETLLIEERLGKDPKQSDYLGISFSAVDVIGHHFGPNSLEAEENLRALDKTIAHFLKVIDKQVGLKNTLIVLSADHGVNDGPTYLAAHRIQEKLPLNKKELTQQIQNELQKQFRLPPEALMSIMSPYVYLNHDLLAQKHLNTQVVSQHLAQWLSLKPGIFKAYALPLRNDAPDWLSKKVEKMAYPYRAGDVYLVWLPNQSNGLKKPYRIAHGSPWNYDSYVPLLFVHPNFKGTKITRPVYTTDIAPTLATLLEIKWPSAAVGEPLNEVIKNNRD